MKKALSKWVVMVVAVLFMSVFSINTSQARGTVSLQVFYDELQPYGTWMDHGQYGYVWIPRVDRGFSPYATNGYWVNTEYGNTWVSDYSWGWAPFHYGRWFYDDFYGWIWVPATEWAPAWVAWRSGGGYYGWAPLMPGFGMQVSFDYYNSLPYSYWNFVPYRYITYRTVYSHCVPRPRVVNIINHTTIVTHRYTDRRSRSYFTGPQRSEIERVSRERVPVYKIGDRSRPGKSDIDRGEVNFYRPEIDDSRATASASRPSRLIKDNRTVKPDQVEPRRERSAESLGDKKTTPLVPNESERGSREERRPGGKQVTPERNPADEDVQRKGIERIQRSEQMENDKKIITDQRSESKTQDKIREQRMLQQEREQTERQNAIREQNVQREREQSNQNVQRKDQQLQRMEQVEKRSRTNSNEQRQPSQVMPESNRRGTAAPRSEQIQRSSPVNRNSQPSRSVERRSPVRRSN